MNACHGLASPSVANSLALGRNLQEARDKRAARAALKSAERALSSSSKPVARRTIRAGNGLVQQMLRKLRLFALKCANSPREPDRRGVT
jgi:hypothetical protein